MEFRKYFVTLKGIKGMVAQPLIYARSLEDAEKQATEYIKRHYTKYWKMKIARILDMGIA